MKRYLFSLLLLGILSGATITCSEAGPKEKFTFDNLSKRIEGFYHHVIHRTDSLFFTSWIPLGIFATRADQMILSMEKESKKLLFNGKISGKYSARSIVGAGMLFLFYKRDKIKPDNRFK